MATTFARAFSTVLAAGRTSSGSFTLPSPQQRRRFSMSPNRSWNPFASCHRCRCSAPKASCFVRKYRLRAVSKTAKVPSGDWDRSAAAWIAHIGNEGDFGRRFVLDEPMLAHIRGRGFSRALDAGCGEGRFCRMMQGEGITTVGIDPTVALVGRGRALDPAGDYRVERAESFECED